MRELLDKIKRHYRFNKEETKHIVICSLIIGFIFSFRNFSIINLIYAVILVTISIFFHVSAQKIAALRIGYNVEFKLWWYGLLSALIVTFISNGKLWWIVLPGGITFSLVAGHRLGQFRYGLNYRTMGIIGFIGPIASIVLGTFFKNIEIYILNSLAPFLQEFFIFNLVYAVCSMLPIPPLDGHYMFFASRPLFAFLFGTIFAYAIFTLVFGLYSWIWALLIGIIIWLIYYISFERGTW